MPGYNPADELPTAEDPIEHSNALRQRLAELQDEVNERERQKLGEQVSGTVYDTIIYAGRKYVLIHLSHRPHDEENTHILSLQYELR